jgi:hypothetical protein
MPGNSLRCEGRPRALDLIRRPGFVKSRFKRQQTDAKVFRLQLSQVGNDLRLH